MENPGHLRLLPGYVAVRRDETHLQVGVDAPHRAILRDSADVRRLLADLAAGRATRPVPSRTALPVLRALDALTRAGLITAVPPAPPAYGVRVEGPPPLVDAIRPLLGDAYLPRRAGLVVVVSRHPLLRDRLDPYIRAGTPHLVVQGGPDAWTVGPFVIPGTTACLRCVDARLGEDDPRRSLVVEQLARSSTHAPADPLLQSLALAWAARDALTHLAGERPATWSATYVFGRATPAQVRRWARHPHCGCAWDLIALQRT